MWTLLLPAAFAGPLDALSWLAGTWTRHEGDSFAQEIWSAPHEGVMVGSFRLQEGARVEFLELLTITELADGAMLRIRHHDAALQPWQDEPAAATFVATKLAGDDVPFVSDTDRASELHFVKKGKDGLVVRLVWRDGSPSAEFPFQRQK